MDKEGIEKYLRMLGNELAKKNIVGDILLLGGAVMLLEIGNRRSTKDIDASFDVGDGTQAAIRKTAIREAVRSIAVNEHLPSDWLNEAAKGFLYSPPPIVLWKIYPGLNVYFPTLDYLLAMKVSAGRPQDVTDIQALIQRLKLPNAEAVLSLVARYIPSNHLTPRMRYFVENIFLQ